MNLFKKLFNLPTKEDAEIKKQEVKLSLDDLFVHNFVKKGGKFLYSINKQELISNFKKVIAENNWEDIHLLDHRLDFLFDKKSINVVSFYIKPIKKYSIKRISAKLYCFCYYKSIS